MSHGQINLEKIETEKEQSRVEDGRREGGGGGGGGGRDGWREREEISTGKYISFSRYYRRVFIQLPVICTLPGTTEHQVATHSYTIRSQGDIPRHGRQATSPGQAAGCWRERERESWKNVEPQPAKCTRPAHVSMHWRHADYTILY